MDSKEALKKLRDLLGEDVYLDLARRYNLHVSAGSDFHGEKVNPSKPLHPVELETDWLFA